MPRKDGARSKGRNHKRKQISTESAEIKALTARVDEVSFSKGLHAHLL